MNSRAIYIVSYQRAHQLKTYEFLQKDLATDIPVYIVVSKDDDQLEDYKALYQEQVLEFSRSEVFQTSDTCFNEINWHTPLYARNFCLRHAKENKIDTILLLDDDLEKIMIRYEEHGKLKGRKATNLALTFDSLFEFVEETGIYGSGVVPANNYIDGLNSAIYKDGFSHFPVSFFAINTKDIPFEFNSHFGEDILLGIKALIAGKPFIIPSQLSLLKQDDGEGEGGMNVQYDDSNEWKNGFVILMNAPSICKMYLTRKNKWRCKFGTRNAGPKILSEVWKK